MNKPYPTTSGRQSQEAITALFDVVSDGLIHGFFDFRITCEIVEGQKRALTINAGKKYRFTIPKEQIAGMQASRLLGLERRDED
jgi:hypothetical protein